jgi:hypothetical protein
MRYRKNEMDAALAVESAVVDELVKQLEGWYCWLMLLMIDERWLMLI